MPWLDVRINRPWAMDEMVNAYHLIPIRQRRVVVERDVISHSFRRGDIGRSACQIFKRKILDQFHYALDEGHGRPIVWVKLRLDIRIPTAHLLDETDRDIHVERDECRIARIRTIPP